MQPHQLANNFQKITQAFFRDHVSKNFNSANFDSQALKALHCFWIQGVLDVVTAQGSEVWGLVFELSDADLERLDWYEGCYKDRTSLYERWKAVIHTPEGQMHDVWVYTVVERQEFVEPTPEYLQIIKNAAVRWDFPEAYRQALELPPVRMGTGA